jgi:hypothetical protein
MKNLTEKFLFIAFLIVIYFISAITHERDLCRQLERDGYATGITCVLRCK